MQHHPPRRRKDRWPGRIFAIGCGLAVVIFASILEFGHGSPTPAASAGGTTAASTTTAASKAKAIAACRARKQTGEIYVRTVDPGATTQAQELGGEWNWDYTTGTCLDSLDFTLASAGTASGECTTVGYVSGNPGYDVNAAPAPALKGVAGEAGPGC